jgi:hypothetical protein
MSFLQAVVKNFSHPLTDEQLAQIAHLLEQKFQKPAKVIENRIHYQVNFEGSVFEQTENVLKAAFDDCENAYFAEGDVLIPRLVTNRGELVLVRPPALTEGTLLSVLHVFKRFTVFPIVPAFRSNGGTPPRFVVYDLYDLHKYYTSA